MGVALGQKTPEKIPKEEIFFLRVAFGSSWGLGQKGGTARWLRVLGMLSPGQAGVGTADIGQL